MTKLGDFTKLIRSKNAGPFWLTIDILFDNYEAYEAVKQSGAVNVSTIASLYHVSTEHVHVTYHDMALAIKVSFPRLVSSGAVGDGDVFGGQQHGPLVDLEIR